MGSKIAKTSLYQWLTPVVARWTIAIAAVSMGYPRPLSLCLYQMQKAQLFEADRRIFNRGLTRPVNPRLHRLTFFSKLD